MAQGIRSFKRRNNDSYDTYRLGAYPQLIEMASSFDLEEELKIGGNKEVIISDFWPGTQSDEEQPFEITEIYYDNTSQHNITYTVKMSISTALENYLIDNNNNVIYTTQELQDKGILVNVQNATDFRFDNGHNIEITLYKGSEQTGSILHIKTIYVRIMQKDGIQLIREVIS